MKYKIEKGTITETGKIGGKHVRLGLVLLFILLKIDKYINVKKLKENSLIENE